jgi:hypothetical protein
MNTGYHLLLSVILLALYPFIGNYVFISILASLLIDIDHLGIIIRHKIYTYKKFKHLVKSTSSKKEKDIDLVYKETLFLLHTVEFNAALLLLSLWYPILGYVALGFLFHIICDTIHHSLNDLPAFRWMSLTLYLVEEIKK